MRYGTRLRVTSDAFDPAVAAVGAHREVHLVARRRRVDRHEEHDRDRVDGGVHARDDLALRRGGVLRGVDVDGSIAFACATSAPVGSGTVVVVVVVRRRGGGRRRARRPRAARRRRRRGQQRQREHDERQRAANPGGRTGTAVNLPVAPAPHSRAPRWADSSRSSGLRSSSSRWTVSGYATSTSTAISSGPMDSTASAGPSPSHRSDRSPATASPSTLPVTPEDGDDPVGPAAQRGGEQLRAVDPERRAPPWPRRSRPRRTAPTSASRRAAPSPR